MEKAIRKGDKVRFRSRKEIKDAKASEKRKFTIANKWRRPSGREKRSGLEVGRR